MDPSDLSFIERFKKNTIIKFGKEGRSSVISHIKDKKSMIQMTRQSFDTS